MTLFPTQAAFIDALIPMRTANLLSGGWYLIEHGPPRLKKQFTPACYILFASIAAHITSSIATPLAVFMR